MRHAGAVVVLLLWLVAGAASALQPREIAALALPSVLLLEFTDDGYKTRSQGSGFIVAPGVVATSYHMVEELTSGKIEARAKIVGGSRFVSVARILAEDPDNDLLLIAVDVGTAAPLKIGNPSQLAIGDPLYAVGNPLGAEGTFSQGILSQRRVTDGTNLLQITAPVSHGSSGGPIVDERGEVVGVLMGGYEGGQNLNLAVSVVHLTALLRTVPGFGGTAPATTPGAIQALDVELYVLADTVNVRARATTDADIVARVNKGAAMTVTGRTGDWYQVQLADRRTGYVLGTLLGPNPNVPPPATVAAAPRAPAPASPAAPPPAAASRTVALTAGFRPDPHVADVVAGGTLLAAARSPECSGFISEQPDFVFTFTAANSTLFLSANSPADTTLVVRTPAGTWLCDDDGAGDNDPLVKIVAPRAGTYSVWVGTYEANAYPDAAVYLSEVGVHGFQVAKKVAALDAGFLPDPFTIDIVAGGGFEAGNRSAGCAGFVAERPDFVLDYNAEATLPLYAYVRSKSDTTLVVRTPAGEWVCDDDGAGGVDPLVRIGTPRSGVYSFWVGAYDKDEFPNAVLHISELAPV